MTSNLTFLEIAQGVIDELRAGVRVYQTYQPEGYIAWGRNFYEMPDGDELFVEVRDDGLDTIYIVGPLLHKAADIQIIADGYEDAIHLVREALEVSR